MSSSIRDLVLQLFDIEAVKFGNFKLKSGVQSPIYFDLRVIVSFPSIMVKVAECMWERVAAANCDFASICGVPYTALPIATVISAKQDIPMLIRRKEAKDYGTKKMIEGRYKQGDTCLIIEDVVTTGSSVLDTVQSLSAEGLVVQDAVVLLNREQGGQARLLENSIKLHSVCTISELLSMLREADRITDQMVTEVHKFLAECTNPAPPPAPTQSVPPEKRMKKMLSYSERAAMCSNPVARRILTIMEQKQSNLAFSADVTSSSQLLQLADSVGPHICVLKTHIDILTDFTASVSEQLQQLAEKHNFVIFEDRKFADIGHTVKQQYAEGVYRISRWADLVNAHPLPGPGVIRGLQEAAGDQTRACLLIAQMSSEGSLATGAYTDAAVQMASDHADFVIGFICQSNVSSDPTHLHFTPGVQLSGGGGDALGQQYKTPEDVISAGSDVIIVGRGILHAGQPAEAAQRYQSAGYQAYLKVLDRQDAHH